MYVSNKAYNLGRMLRILLNFCSLKLRDENENRTITFHYLKQKHHRIKKIKIECINNYLAKVFWRRTSNVAIDL